MSDPLIDRLFIGAGAMKAGTTWLYAVLSRHPEIHFSPEKEIHYFYAAHVRPEVLSERNRLENARRKYLGIDPDRSRAAAVRDRLRWAANYLDGPVDDHWYRNLFCLRRNQRWVADFSNLYAHLPEEAWRRIADRAGEVRVVYTMRDPVERLWSHAKFHLKITGNEDRLDRWARTEMTEFVRQPFIWENAEYGAAIARMRSGLPDGALQVLFYENIHAEPAASVAGPERFLSIPAHKYPEDLLTRRVNATDARPVPGEFRDAVARDCARIVSEVCDAGFVPPSSWGHGAKQVAVPAA